MSTILTNHEGNKITFVKPYLSDHAFSALRNAMQECHATFIGRIVSVPANQWERMEGVLVSLGYETKESPMDETEAMLADLGPAKPNAREIAPRKIAEAQRDDPRFGVPANWPSACPPHAWWFERARRERSTLLERMRASQRQSAEVEMRRVERSRIEILSPECST